MNLADLCFVQPESYLKFKILKPETFLSVFILERKREYMHMSEKGTERQGKKESEAGSALSDQSAKQA